MIIRLMSHRQALALQLLTALAVDLQAAVDLICLAVVLEYPAHVTQHSHDSFTRRRSTIAPFRRRILFRRAGSLRVYRHGFIYWRYSILGSGGISGAGIF